MNDNRLLGISLFGIAFGVYSFFFGFNRLRRKRMIENIPTSTIRSIAMGLVEIIGTAEKTPALTTPLTGSKCVFYKYTVQRLESRGKSSRWVTIAAGSSKDSMFFVKDSTGEVAVSPEGAEILIPVSYQYSMGGYSKGIPENITLFLEKNKIKYKLLFGSKASLRFIEWRIAPGDTVYIIGTASKNNALAGARKEKLLSRIEALKNDPEKMREIDTDKDNNITAQEWDAAVLKIESELLEHELESSKYNELHDIVIEKGDSDKIFIISNHGQEKLLNILSLQSVAGIIGGVVIVLAALCYILYCFNMFR
jgi:hypothetical protein